jgi:hypothetical protein
MGIQSKRYRPELHYMRGPGPRWHEKHAVPVSLVSARGFPLPRSSWVIAGATIILMVAVTALALA